MTKKVKTDSIPLAGMGCCQVMSVVTVDARGQLVLPKEIREKAGIKPGEKLAVVSWEKDGKTCCIALIKADSLAEMVKGFLGPVMSETSIRQSKSERSK